MSVRAAAWAADLAAWAIPAEILAAAPESPWGHPVALFRARRDESSTPSSEAAAAALPVGGAVLDVGCGGGRAAMALVPPAARVVGVDREPRMLEAFAAAAADRGVGHAEVLGSWPEVSDTVESADVAVSHHTAYDTPDLEAFARALHGHARHRVVLELTGEHPMARLAPLWRRFWDLGRPAGPTADDAAEVLREAGLPVRSRAWTQPDAARHAPLTPAELVALTRRRLCLPTDRDAEVAEALAELGEPPPRQVVTLWWDV